MLYSGEHECQFNLVVFVYKWKFWPNGSAEENVNDLEWMHPVYRTQGIFETHTSKNTMGMHICVSYCCKCVAFSSLGGVYM